VPPIERQEISLHFLTAVLNDDLICTICQEATAIIHHFLLRVGAEALSGLVVVSLLTERFLKPEWAWFFCGFWAFALIF
jgi:hypothetical protein